ncbi:MAG: protein translocase subunit SecF [Chloroflexi bacterium]|nr:protein translocase subunit SecF [Chloroflexota bacterium]
MIDFVSKRYWYFLLSALIIVPGLVSLMIPPGLRMGVDFVGGTLWGMAFPRSVVVEEVRSILTQNGHPEAAVQTSGDFTILIRTKQIAPDSPERAAIATALRDAFGDFTGTERFDSVEPTFGAEIARRAMMAVALASLGILLYITWAFRRLPNPFRYGVCAIAALLHDVLVVVGLFSIFGKLFQIEVDALFVTAVLTVIGFSVHDTIVVFDRIRENLIRHQGVSFATATNHSLAQTLVRSLNTSLTLLITLVALVLFGGETTRNFALAIFIGTVSGTYSSIFNASQLLVVWEQGDVRRWFGFGRAQASP